MVYRFRSVAAAIVCGVLLSSCMGGSVPPDTFYRLAVPGSAGALTTIDAAVEVAPVRADGVLNDRAILYSDGDTVLRKYSYHFWIEPPSSLIQDYLVDRLKDGAVFSQVAEPELRVDRDYDLIGVLERFEHMTAGGPDQVIVKLRFSLRKIRGNDTLLLKTYEERERVSGGSVAAAVDAFSDALDRVYADLQADIAALSLSE